MLERVELMTRNCAHAQGPKGNLITDSRNLLQRIFFHQNLLIFNRRACFFLIKTFYLCNQRPAKTPKCGVFKNRLGRSLSLLIALITKSEGTGSVADDKKGIKTNQKTENVQNVCPKT